MFVCRYDCIDACMSLVDTRGAVCGCVCVYVGLCVLMLGGMYTGMLVSSAHIRCGMCVCASMLVRPCVVIYIGMIVLMDACLWPTRVLRYVHVFVYVCV